MGRSSAALITCVALSALLLALAPVITLGVDPMRLDKRSYAAVGNLVAATLAAAMIIGGAAQWHRSRRTALHWFKMAMLLSIFVVQPYAFFADQLGALGGLLVDLALLLGVNYLLSVSAVTHGLTAPGGEHEVERAERGVAHA